MHQDEQVINHLEPMITEYLIKISHLALTEKEIKVVNNLFDSITDIERAGDHVENIAGYLQHLKDLDAKITEGAVKELEDMNQNVRGALEAAIQAIGYDDTEKANQAIAYAREVLKMKKQIRKKHIQRMKQGNCAPEAGVYFLDIVSSMERISGYADSIARYILDQNEEN